MLLVVALGIDDVLKPNTSNFGSFATLSSASLRSCRFLAPLLCLNLCIVSLVMIIALGPDRTRASVLSATVSRVTFCC